MKRTAAHTLKLPFMRALAAVIIVALGNVTAFAEEEVIALTAPSADIEMS